MDEVSGDYLADYFGDDWDYGDGAGQPQPQHQQAHHEHYDHSAQDASSAATNANVAAAAAAATVAAVHAQNAQQMPSTTSPDTDNSRMTWSITSADLRPTDILCGRGNYSNPGNATFVQVCEAHRDEYTSCKSFREKQVVADKIYDELCRAGSGRFLQLVKGPNRKKDRAKGGGSSTEEERTSYWKEMDRKDIGVKIKQGLRQKRNPPKRGRQQQAATSAAAAVVAGSDQLQQQQQMPTPGAVAAHPYEYDGGGSASQGLSHYEAGYPVQVPAQQHYPPNHAHAHASAPAHLVDPGDSSAAAAAAALLDGAIDDVDVDLLEMLATATDLNDVDASGFGAAAENGVGVSNGTGSTIDASAIEPVPLPLPQHQPQSVGVDVITQKPSPDAASSSETETNKRGCLPADGVNGNGSVSPEVDIVTSPAAPSADGQLRFPEGKLYGREEHILALRESLDKVIPNKRGLVLVSGYPGSGKSELIDQIRPQLAEKKAMLIWTKFDVRGRMQARSPLIFKAFDEYCKQLLKSDPAVLAEVRNNVMEALGADAVVLKDLIPSLGDVIGDIDDAKADDHHDKGRQEMQRIVYHVRDFVRAIASTQHPVCMVFDDMQWANEQCLELVSKLVTDTKSSSILFVGTYRDNESKSDLAPLQECLGEIAMAAVPMSNISLENLSVSNVNELVSASLGLPPQHTLPLSNALHTKTRGNPMFVKQLMRALVGEKLLSYSAIARRWQWNLQAIQLKAIADNAVDLLVDKMMKSYGAKNRDLLRMASCLGSSFDETTMMMLCSQYSGCSQQELPNQLGEMTSDGMLIQSGPTYKFSHDQIWQACYELTPIEEREDMHLKSESQYALEIST